MQGTIFGVLLLVVEVALMFIYGFWADYEHASSTDEFALRYSFTRGLLQKLQGGAYSCRRQRHDIFWVRLFDDFSSTVWLQCYWLLLLGVRASCANGHSNARVLGTAG